MAALSTESLALARRAGQECAALRALIVALTERVADIEAGGGGGGSDQFTALGITVGDLSVDGQFTLTKASTTFTFTGTLP